MITWITGFMVLFSLILLLPLEEMFPERNLQRTLSIILSRDEKGAFISTSNLIAKLQPALQLIIASLKIDGQAKKWRKYAPLLRSANLERILNTEQFIAIKFLASGMVLAYFFLMFLIKPDVAFLLLGMAVSAAMYISPDQWLKIQISKRRLKIQKEIPSVLISLAVTTDAGLSFIQALEEVCECKNGELTEEIRKTLFELSIGISQKEAFQNLASRVRVEELTLFVSVITQTLEKGSSGVTKVLREQANEAWIKRKNKAKELGEKASIKLFFPLVLFIFPALMIFLISPAIFSIIKFFIP